MSAVAKSMLSELSVCTERGQLLLPESDVAISANTTDSLCSR